MKSELLTDEFEKTYALIFDKGDEVMKNITDFAMKNNITSASFTGIGAFSRVVVGYFMWDKKEYKNIFIEEQVEVLSFNGDIALEKDSPKVHAHVVVGKADGTAHGGHVIEAYVRPTLELILKISPAHLQKKFDPESGISLININS